MEGRQHVACRNAKSCRVPLPWSAGGSGLLLRSSSILETDPGSSPEHVLTASLSLPESQYLRRGKSKTSIGN